MTLTLVGDATVALLLVIMIFYAAKLSRRLAALRADKAELKALIDSLAAASASAEAGIRALKAAAGNVGQELEARVQRAKSLRDDLTYLSDRGATIADRLEGSVRSRREEAKVEPGEAPRPTAPARTSAEPPAPRREPGAGGPTVIREMASRLAAAQASRSERDLARALAGRR
jgi:hypothetical protein